MARKPKDIVSLNLRLPERLRKHLATEARKANRSLNQELVNRLERTFIDQGVNALIQTAVMSAATEFRKDLLDHIANIHEHFDAVAKAMGRPDLIGNLNKGESNG